MKTNLTKKEKQRRREENNRRARVVSKSVILQYAARTLVEYWFEKYKGRIQNETGLWVLYKTFLASDYLEKISIKKTKKVLAKVDRLVALGGQEVIVNKYKLLDTKGLFKYNTMEEQLYYMRRIDEAYLDEPGTLFDPC